MFRPMARDAFRSDPTVDPPPAGRPAFLDGRFRSFVQRSPGRSLVLFLATTLVAIGVFSMLQRWVLFRPAADVLAADTLRDLIAATLWIPLGWLAVRLARRTPLRRGIALRGIALHLIAGACAGVALNVAWTGIIALTGLWPDPAITFGRLALRTAIGFLHINIAIWLLIAAVASAWRVRPDTDQAMPEPAPDDGPDRIAIRTNGRTTVVDVERIDWVEAAGDYARLHVAGRSYLLGERMHALEARLGTGFVRVHRSAIVNLARIREVLPRPAGDASLVLRDETVVPLSRRRRAAVLARLDPSAES